MIISLRYFICSAAFEVTCSFNHYNLVIYSIMNFIEMYVIWKMMNKKKINLINICDRIGTSFMSSLAYLSIINRENSFSRLKIWRYVHLIIWTTKKNHKFIICFFFLHILLVFIGVTFELSQWLTDWIIEFTVMNFEMK